MDEIEILKNGIEKNLRNKQPYSQRMVASLSIEAFKRAYNGERTLESFAYQRGLENGMSLILGMMDKINKAEL